MVVECWDEQCVVHWWIVSNIRLVILNVKLQRCAAWDKFIRLLKLRDIGIRSWFWTSAAHTAIFTTSGYNSTNNINQSNFWTVWILFTDWISALTMAKSHDPSALPKKQKACCWCPMRITMNNISLHFSYCECFQTHKSNRHIWGI